MSICTHSARRVWRGQFPGFVQEQFTSRNDVHSGVLHRGLGTAGSSHRWSVDSAGDDRLVHANVARKSELHRTFLPFQNTHSWASSTGDLLASLRGKVLGSCISSKGGWLDEDVHRDLLHLHTRTSSTKGLQVLGGRAFERLHKDGESGGLRWRRPTRPFELHHNGWGVRGFSTAWTSPGKDWGNFPERVGTDASVLTELALDSVVKIFAMASSPNYILPWQNKPQREITGSGFVISGRRIITNAHVVADQTYVAVRKHGSPCKYRAEVKAVGHECDLALLQVNDEEFWEGMRTLQLGDIPYLQESVAVVGYPQGGDNISVTGGVVSRVEPTQYVHGAAHLMAIQIDAAINPGNSGGPALMDDKVVGVAFQNLAGAENIGYIIPVPIINHFLEDIEEKDCYVGFCTLGLACQATENSQLREHLKMPANLTGVLVSKIQPLTDTNRWVKKDDVLLAFDGVPIANDGTVHFRNRERISFDHLVSMKKAGEEARITVLRDGIVMEFNIELAPLRFLVPIHQFDRLPSYFIFAGLVFIPLTQPYLHEYGDDWYNNAPRRLCDKALTGILTSPGEQVVILSQVLIDEVNAGFERLADFQVLKVNGVEVHNLKHLKELVEGCTLSSLRFDLDEGRVLVLNLEKAKSASDRILLRYRIPSYASTDLLQALPQVHVCEKPQSVESLEEPNRTENHTSLPV